MKPPALGPLELTPDEMRATGYAVVDLLVDALADPGAPVRRPDPRALEERLGDPPPEQPLDFEQILARISGDLIPATARGDHPGFFAFIPYCSNWPSALADFVAGALNLDACMWCTGAGPITAELSMVRWLADLVGYPAEAGGIFVSGGSAANLTALACARETLVGSMSDRLTIYLSDQCHSSFARAARALGFRSDQVRVVPTDQRFAIRLDALEATIDRDIADARVPLAVVANAGATSTGAIDPLGKLSELCASRDMWLHVDAAYGGAAALTERGARALAGIDRADSITLDPHKWLYQPWECGCLLVRRQEALIRAFSIAPDYLQDIDGEKNLGDWGLQLSRGARALKLWWSLQAFGVDAFRRAIDASLDLAALAVERIEAHPALELLAPPSLGIVCFRRTEPAIADDEEQLERINAELVAELERSGIGFLSSTRAHGRFALRLCVMNHTTRAEHVERVVDFLAEHPVGRRFRTSPPLPLRDLTVGAAAVDNRPLAVSLGDVPMFDGLSEEERIWVASLGEEREVDAGTQVLEQWQTSRDLYVVLAGQFAVLDNGEQIAVRGYGDVFGELAALDWGAGYGAPRRAAIEALEDGRLLVLQLAATEALLRRFPPVAARLRGLAAERLRH